MRTVYALESRCAVLTREFGVLNSFSPYPGLCTNLGLHEMPITYDGQNLVYLWGFYIVEFESIVLLHGLSSLSVMWSHCWELCGQNLQRLGLSEGENLPY